MAELTARDRLRRAYSYFEHAHAAGDAAHEENASALVEEARRGLSSEAERLGKRLRAMLLHQTALNESVMSGRIEPHEANEKNRTLTAQITELRGEIAALNVLLAARNATDFGGFINLPLDGYSPFPDKRPPKISLKPTRTGFIVWLVCFIGAIIGVLIYMDAIPWVHEVRLTAQALPSATVKVTVVNRGASPITLSVPRGADGQTAPYGIAVYGQEAGGAFTPIVTTGCWSFSGSVLQENGLFEVGPGFSDEFVLNVKKLEEGGLKPVALRIVVENRRGHALSARVLAVGR